MEAIKKLKVRLAKAFLRKKAKPKREITFHNFETVKTIGILFNATQIDDWELVKQYIRYLKENGKKVKAIGYFNSPALPEFSYSKLDYDYFCNKNVGLLLKPDISFSESFINNEFDLLVDLNIYEDFPLYYMAALSSAKFKIGKYKNRSQVHDLMIELEVGKGLKYFMRNIDHYIMKINREPQTT